MNIKIKSKISSSGKIRLPVLIFALWAFVSVSAVIAQDNASSGGEFLKKRTPVIAILPFRETNTHAKEQGYGKSIAAMLGTHIRNETNFQVLEQGAWGEGADLDASFLSQTVIQGLINQHGLEVILTGEVSQISEAIHIDTRLITAKTGKVAVAEFAVVNNLGELRDKIRELSKSIELKYLRQWMGNIILTTAPVESDVYLDGVFMGKALTKPPLQLENLLAGEYRLKVLAGGYREYTKVIEVKSRSSREMHIILKPLPGALKITSEPDNALIRLNGDSAGFTPFSLDTIQEGKYEIHLDMENFQSWSQSVNIRPGQLTEVKGIMEVIPGKLILDSRPAGADVMFDRRHMGPTPLVLKNVKPGTYSIALSLQNYATKKEQVTVKPGQNNSLSFDLQKLQGTLTVIADKSGAVATITRQNQEPVTKSLPIHQLPLDIGLYQITVSKSRYLDIEQPIRLRANKEMELNLKMEEKPGTLKISGNTFPNTDVFIDGKYMGKTINFDPRVNKGGHNVQLANYFFRQDTLIQVESDGIAEVPQGHTSRYPYKWWVPFSTAALIVSLFLMKGNE